TGGHNPNLGFQPVNPVSFDIKNTVLSALKENQFSGSESECPNIHLARFYEACGYTDLAGVSESNKKLRLFPLSLTGRAKDWIDTLPPNTITSWDELELKFCERYFPIHKFLERRNDITNSEQGDSESLYDAWERFKLCLKKCPTHGLDSHAQMQHFTQGLRAHTRMLLDASAGGSLKNKDESEARELVEAMAQNEYRVQNDRGAKKKAGMLELDTQTAILAQSQLMNNQMAAMLKHFTTALAPPMQAKAVQDVKCNLCGQGHANGECFPSPEVVSREINKSSNEGVKEKGEVEKEESNESKGDVEKEWEIITESEDERDALVENQREKKIENKSADKLFAQEKGKGMEEKEIPKEKEISYHAKLPFPRKKKAKVKDHQQFKKFMKMLHSLQMNIPFAEALEQMPVYAKFMKELLTKKRKPLDDDTVDMTEECNEIAALMTQLAIANSCNVPHVFYNEESTLYQAARARQAAFQPPPVFPRYQTQARLVAYQGVEAAQLNARHMGELEEWDHLYAQHQQQQFFTEEDLHFGDRDAGGSSQRDPGGSSHY
ncbi:hypothetical protein TSUD_415390, partial [Trifolium subterraneum]